MDWQNCLSERKTAEVQFKDWTQNRQLPTLGTNAGAKLLPFQTWHRFKEAYAPELIERAVKESAIPVRHILDTFGGSGTSALAAQFLGVHSTSIEINPFLADVIKAKTQQYNSGMLTHDLGVIVRSVMRNEVSLDRFSVCPPTFIEPGVKGRYIFSVEIASVLAGLLTAIDKLADESHQRLFRVLLGGILVAVSNVYVNGKGRRYRRGWQNKTILASSVLEMFSQSASRAIEEIDAHSNRRNGLAQVINADSRLAVSSIQDVDLVVFSPPYPNSFDYTDVYNVELWMLGYLTNFYDNRVLRKSTLSSHVQVSREYSKAPAGSQTLDNTMELLKEKRSLLWSPWIPEMVGAYFSDMSTVLTGCSKALKRGGEIWMVVGNSQYAGISIDVDQILIELAPTWGLSFKEREPFRSMRASAQQGGKQQLAETLVILAKQ